MPAETVADPETMSASGRVTSPGGSVHVPALVLAGVKTLQVIRATRRITTSVVRRGKLLVAAGNRFMAILLQMAPTLLGAGEHQIEVFRGIIPRRRHRVP